MNTVEFDTPSDTPTLVPQPKFFDQRFWTGFGSGVAAGVCGLIAAIALLTLFITHQMRSAQKNTGGTAAAPKLSAPPFQGVDKADYGLRLTRLDGTAFDAESLRGHVVFLNFWATWCGPCHAEMPAIQRLYDRTRGDSVAFAAVSDEKGETITAFLKKNTYSFPVYRIAGKPPGVYQTSGIPATFILAPDGRIAFKHTGAARWDDDTAIAFLKNLALTTPH
jgi:thiol-disulfide isomerase/thioredoxin